MNMIAVSADQLNIHFVSVACYWLLRRAQLRIHHYVMIPYVNLSSRLRTFNSIRVSFC